MVLLVLAGCSHTPTPDQSPITLPQGPPAVDAVPELLPYPPMLPGQPVNVYAAAGADMLRPDLRDDLPRVYVPNTKSDDVHVIDPLTFKVIGTFPGGPEPQHVVPSYDMRTLYVTSSRTPGGAVLPIDPRTGKPKKLIAVQDVYNLYFTPDGRYAIVVAEAYRRLDYYDPVSWRRVKSIRFADCAGINHMDYSIDGKTMLFSCEFAHRLLAIDVASGRVLRRFDLHRSVPGKPQDVRLMPDGSAFLVADMHANGVYVLDGQATKQIGFIETGRGAHSVYFSRDGRRAYVSNRDEGSISVLDTSTRKQVAKWRIRGGGSPDMGGVSADGKTLWLSGRYHNEVYAISTEDGSLRARIPVGAGPHGLTVWPQPGRYSLGHTGNIR